MRRVIRLGLVPCLLLSMATGCAKYPSRLTAEAAGRIKTVALLDEISTPTSLHRDTGMSMALGAIPGTVVDAYSAKSFTAKVSANLDFQKFAEDTLRTSFTKVLKDHQGWTLVPSNQLDKADAAFLVNVIAMGVAPAPQPLSEAFAFKAPRYAPEVTISATLIDKPPFEVVRSRGGDVQALDPGNHPILYHRVESILAREALARHTLSECRDPEVFKAALRKAIDAAVERVAASWTSGRTPR